MCPWVGPHAPSFGRQLWGLPSRVGYLSPEGVLLPLVYATTASALLLELRGLSDWQVTPSWTVYQLACHPLLPWLWVTFAMVPDAAWARPDQQPWGTAPAAGPVGRLGRPGAPDPWGVDCCFPSLGCPGCARVIGVLGHLVLVHQCARWVPWFACAVSWATWLLFTGVPVGALCCVCGVVGHLTPFHRCVCSVCCVACAVSSATWLLFTVVPARCVAFRVRCFGPLGCCSPVCPLGALCCVCGFWASWLLFPGVPPRCDVLPVRCPGPLGSYLTVCPLAALCCVCGVLGPLGPCLPVHAVWFVVSRPSVALGAHVWSVSWAYWLLFTGVSARCLVLRVQCPGPFGSSSLVCPLGALCCVCGVLGHLARVRRCARSVCCVVCAVSWATLLSFTGVSARCVAVRVRCPGPLGSCSPVCPRSVLCCVCGVLGLLALVHFCAQSVRRVACAVSWATWLLFTGVSARCVVLRLRCPRPLGSCSPVCPLGALCCVCGALGHLAPVHRCARAVPCVACAVSWASWLLFTGVSARCVVLCVRCPGPLGSCSLVCPRGVLCCLCGVLAHLTPVHACARSVRCVASTVSWATWLLFSAELTRSNAVRVRCPGPLGSCALLCPVGASCCVCGVLGHLAAVHWCVCAVRCVAFAVSSASWFLFTGVSARCVVLRVRCPWPLGSCSPVCPRGALRCVCGVLGLLAPVHRCVCSVRCVVCAVSWTTWLLFTGVPTRCVVLLVRCPRPLDSCSRVCSLRALRCVYRVLGHLAPVLR